MERSYNQKRKNTIIMGSLCAIVVLMSVGYAVFNTVLDISGTSSIKSTWNIHFDENLKSETEVDTLTIDGINVITTKPGLERATKPTGSVTYPDSLTANLTASLNQPGDVITYKLKVINDGSLDAKLTSVEVSEPDNEIIQFSNSTQAGFITDETNLIKVGDTLERGTSKFIVLEVTYKDIAGGQKQPEKTTSNIKVELNFEQDGGNNSGTTPGGGGITPPDLIKDENLATNGEDGLHKDNETEYIYKGGNPDNYITFNDETWRILAIEKDKTTTEDKWNLKLIKASAISSTKAWDTVGQRTTGYCSKGEAPNYGCNAWSQITNFVNNPYNGAVDKDATLNDYLNKTYYNILSDAAKSQIISHSWNIGPVAETDTNLANSVATEKSITTNAKVGLATATEYVKASKNSACTSVNAYYYYVKSACYSNSQTHNWIFNIAQTSSNKYMWLLSPIATSASYVLHVYSNGNLNDSYAYTPEGVAPVIYLNSNITLSGEGTQGNPYTIVS